MIGRLADHLRRVVLFAGMIISIIATISDHDPSNLTEKALLLRPSSYPCVEAYKTGPGDRPGDSLSEYIQGLLKALRAF